VSRIQKVVLLLLLLVVLLLLQSAHVPLQLIIASPILVVHISRSPHNPFIYTIVEVRMSPSVPAVDKSNEHLYIPTRIRNSTTCINQSTNAVRVRSNLIMQTNVFRTRNTC